MTGYKALVARSEYRSKGQRNHITRRINGTNNLRGSKNKQGRKKLFAPGFSIVHTKLFSRAHAINPKLLGFRQYALLIFSTSFWQTHCTRRGNALAGVKGTFFKGGRYNG